MLCSAMEGTQVLFLLPHKALSLEGPLNSYVLTHLSKLNKFPRASYVVLLEGSSAASLVLRGC